MKVKLEGKNIPRNKNGDPSFEFLENPNGVTDPPSLMQVFTTDEIVELVNRCLYQLEYQKNAHRKRAEEERAAFAPIKLALKIVHPSVSWSKATEEQINDAVKYLKGEK